MTRKEDAFVDPIPDDAWVAFEPQFFDKYLIKHLLAPGDVGAIIGQPGCGKSMLAPYIAQAVAQGRPLFGMRTKPGRVLYAVAEDAYGMSLRGQALSSAHGQADDFIFLESGNLREMSGSRRIVKVVERFEPALVIIDTVGAAWAGMDENSSVDMGNVVRLAREIAATDAAVLLVHHSAKFGDSTPRGHSVLNGTLDMSMLLEMGDDRIVRCKLLKNRRGTTDLTIAFRATVVVLGKDSDGDDITAPMAVELEGETPKPSSMTDASKGALRVLRELAERGSVTDEQWRAECDGQRAVSASDKPDSRRKAFHRAREDLLKSGYIAATGSNVSISPEAPL